MECQRDPEIVAAYVDDELGPAELAELEVHLAGCAPCREQVAAERRLGELFATLPSVGPPGDFEARFWARVARERDLDHASGLAARLRRWFTPRVLSLGVAAAGVALLLLVPRGGYNPTSALRVPEADAPIVANSEDFELVQDPDLDAISMVDVLEDWDDASPNDAPPS